MELCRDPKAGGIGINLKGKGRIDINQGIGIDIGTSILIGYGQGDHIGAVGPQEGIGRIGDV